MSFQGGPCVEINSSVVECLCVRKSSQETGSHQQHTTDRC